MGTAQLADCRLNLGTGLRRVGMWAMRAIRQSVQALISIPPDPAVHRLPRDAEPLGYLGHRHTGLDFQHGPIPLLCQCQLHQHSAECHASCGTTV